MLEEASALFLALADAKRLSLLRYTEETTESSSLFMDTFLKLVAGLERLEGYLSKASQGVRSGSKGMQELTEGSTTTEEEEEEEAQPSPHATGPWLSGGVDMSITDVSIAFRLLDITFVKDVRVLSYPHLVAWSERVYDRFPSLRARVTEEQFAPCSVPGSVDATTLPLLQRRPWLLAVDDVTAVTAPERAPSTSHPSLEPQDDRKTSATSYRLSYVNAGAHGANELLAILDGGGCDVTPRQVGDLTVWKSQVVVDGVTTYRFLVKGYAWCSC